MSKTEKTTYLTVERRRYARLKTKQEKTRRLDGFCAATGLERKHAIKQLNKAPGASRRRGRRRTYDLRTLLETTDPITLKTAVQTAMNTFRRLEARLANTPRRTRK